EIARKMQEDWETEEERKRLAKEEATNATLIQDFDDIKERIEADRLLALRLQEEERERESKQRAITIRNRPPTRTQLRNQMMTYLKHVGNKKQSDLKSKTFEEIQALYEKVKRFDESFTVVGSTKDERKIKEMDERAKDLELKRLNKKVAKETPKKEYTTKVPAKVDVTEQGTKKRKGGHTKMIAGKRKRPQPDVDSNDEHREYLKIVTFEGTIDSDIIKKKSFIVRMNKVSSPDGDYLVIYRANGNFRAFNCLLEVLHVFDRQDLFHLYDLVMEQYSEITLEGIELILWGDLKIMMESSTEENDQSNFWNDQQDWEIVTWRLYEACGVHILELKDGAVIHMLVERRYSLSKDLLQRMFDLGLEVEREITAALDLIRFIKQQIDEKVFNSPCFMVKSWLVQDQTVSGKDYSNLLIADSLLKTIWFINAPCYGNEALASPKANELTIPEQTATGKGISNPFMAGSLPKTTKPTYNTWIYDTGYGTHICNTIQRLKGYWKLNKGALDMYVGNGNTTTIEAIRSFDLILPSGMILVLDNFFKDNIVYFNAFPHDGIFEIDMHNYMSNEHSIYTCSNKKTKHNLDSTFLWHCRVGHINKKCIEKLQHDGMLELIDDESFDVCVSCISDKIARKHFTHASERSDDLLGIIHSDVCRPFRTTYREGANYYVTFTDDFSRYGYVYLIKHKHEVFEMFKTFQNEVENQLRKTIKALRSDRRGDYLSQVFLDHLRSRGIISQLTPPYTPQHNGVSERRNRTLLDMVQSMMSLTTLLMSFWGYALEFVVRILNMVPTKEEGSGSTIDSDEIQSEDAQPSENTSLHQHEVKYDTIKPQTDVILVSRSASIPQAPERYGFYIDAEEHKLGDHGEPPNY
ncbi:retrotransposon protein, putative, ty1-copia subclass, partial [Tanacetum coccineum]